MKRKYCSYCPLDGTCENQDRGYECEMPIKKLFEENQQLKKDNRVFEEKIHNSYLKMGQLKELLKECRPYVARSAASRMIKNSVGHKKDMNLLTKIDNATGEKK